MYLQKDSAYFSWKKTNNLSCLYFISFYNSSLHYYVVKLKISTAYNSTIPLQSRTLKKVQELLL